MKIKTKRYYIYCLLAIGSFIIAILPLKLGLCLANLAGKIAFAISRKERRITIDNLKTAFPEKNDAEIKKIARNVFSNLSKNAIEWANIYKLNGKTIYKWVKAEGTELVDDALSKGKGVIMLVSHFGNWELISAYFTLRGYRGTAIVRRIYFDRYDKFINRLRSHIGLGVVYRDDSPKKILKVLKHNELLGILADQDVDSVDGVFVDFFGKPAFTPRAPVAIALASKAPLIPCFMIREKNKHKLMVENPVQLEKKSNKEETIKFNTQKWSRVIESYIRRYPDQWVWMHRRWKTKPEDIVTRDAVPAGRQDGRGTKDE